MSKRKKEYERIIDNSSYRISAKDYNELEALSSQYEAFHVLLAFSAASPAGKEVVNILGKLNDKLHGAMDAMEVV